MQNEHRTFTVQGTFPTIREAMRQRGWIEKEVQRQKATTSLDDASFPSSISLLASLSQSDGRNTEALLVARLLRHVKVDFLWTIRSEPVDWQAVQRKQIVNRFPRAYFTTKVGLCAYLQHMHWFCENGVSHILFPRCYNVCQPDELTAFTDDFRITACLGLLKWLVSKYEKQGESSLKSVEGKVPITAVEFALKRCQEYVGVQTHEDIDKQESISIWDHQWDQFLTWYYLAVHDNFLLLECRTTSIVNLYESAKHVLLDIRKFWPQVDLDGMNNIWIVKPGAQSRGRGIQLTNKLDKVMDKVNPAAMKESRYVVQKYLEHPLLVYDTKFDIRQWFLVTCAQPLTIWMYKESYLRFCSQPFDLKDMHESVHLCNNAVQCKYKNGKRNPSLPDENMWDCYTFQTYLRGIGHADMWDNYIYPGMRQSIICALLASQEHMDRRRNCFELFGADFMLSQDFSPWLIEINSCPCMQPTTSVTARMCSQCLEDVIKVVVDKRSNRRASTGMFELIYRQQVPRAPAYLGMSLSVRGTKVHHSVPIPRSRIRSAIKVKKQRDSSEEQESYSSGPDYSKKMRKSVMTQRSFSRRPKTKNSNGSSEEHWQEKIVIENTSKTSFESRELFTKQSEQPSSRENIMVIHSRDSSEEQELVGSDSKYVVKMDSSANISQINGIKLTNNEPGYNLDRDYSSEEREHFVTDSETILEKKCDIHSTNSTDFTSVSCEDEEIQTNETELNCSRYNYEDPSSTCGVARNMVISEKSQLVSSPEHMLQGKNAKVKKPVDSFDESQSTRNRYEGSQKKDIGIICSRSSAVEQRSLNSVPDCIVKKAGRPKISARHQLTSSSPENMMQMKSTGIKKSEDSSNERESTGSGPELNIQKRKRSIRVKNLKPRCTEYGAVSNVSDSTVSKNTNSTLNKSKEEEFLKNGSEQTVRESLRIKKSAEQNSGGSGTELTLRNKRTCRVQTFSESSDDHQSVSSGSENTFHNRKSTRIKNVRNSCPEYIRERKRSAAKKIIRDSSDERVLFDGDTKYAAQKKKSHKVKNTYDSSEEQELYRSGSEKTVQKRKNSRIKYQRESSEDRELSSEKENPSQKKKKNSWEKCSSHRSGAEEQCSITKQSRNKSTEKGKINHSSSIQKKIQKTAEYIGPIIVDLIEDLTNQLSKAQKTKQKSNKTAVYVTPGYKETKPNSKAYGKGSTVQNKAHTMFLQVEKKAEVQESDVIKVQETEGNSKNETSVMRDGLYDRTVKTYGKSWSYPKDGLSVSHFTETIYPNVDEAILKQKQSYSCEWKNRNDAEKSMDFFNEWRQKLDRTKASCEDMVAKLKMVRDSENMINKPKYHSIDKGINWEGEIANKPTISDIIKKLSQTQPEREFFMCNVGRRFIDTLPEHILPNSKEKIKRKQCDLNMFIEDNMNFVAKHNQRLCSELSDQRLSITPHVFNHPSADRHPVPMAMRGILPHIKQRIKQPSSNSLFYSGHKMDNFFAVGMSLKTLQASHNQKQHLLLPLGSDHCLGVNSTIPQPMEGSFL